MKALHLLAACIGLGSMFGAAATPQQTTLVVRANDSVKHAIPSLSPLTMAMLEESYRGGRRGGAPAASWMRKNQRQVRLARRRAHAAGCKKAFR